MRTKKELCELLTNYVAEDFARKITLAEAYMRTKEKEELIEEEADILKSIYAVYEKEGIKI